MNNKRGHAIGKKQKAMLEFVRRHKNAWHTIAKDVVTQRVAKSLAKRDLILLNEYNQIRSIES